MGERFSAREIVQTWHVSLKTARRDISALLHFKLGSEQEQSEIVR